VLTVILIANMPGRYYRSKLNLSSSTALWCIYGGWRRLGRRPPQPPQRPFLLPAGEGNAPVRCVPTQGASTGEAMANAVPLAGGSLEGPCKASHRAVFRSAPAIWRAGAGRPVRACGGHAAQRSRVRAGIRTQSISRGLSGSRPGQPGRRALKRGRWISQLPRVCEAAACRMGTPSGEFRAARALRHPYSTCSEGTARARPSGLQFSHPGGSCRAASRTAVRIFVLLGTSPRTMAERGRR